MELEIIWDAGFIVLPFIPFKSASKYSIKEKGGKKMKKVSKITKNVFGNIGKSSKKSTKKLAVVSTKVRKTLGINKIGK